MPSTPGCAGPVTYSIYRSTTSGFTPGIGNRIAAGVTGTTYSDHSPLTSGTPYYYPGGVVQGRPVPGGYYSEPVWKTALVAGGVVLYSTNEFLTISMLPSM